jgi:hypothetical protein
MTDVSVFILFSLGRKQRQIYSGTLHKDELQPNFILCLVTFIPHFASGFFLSSSKMMMIQVFSEILRRLGR